MSWQFWKQYHYDYHCLSNSIDRDYGDKIEPMYGMICGCKNMSDYFELVRYINDGHYRYWIRYKYNAILYAVADRLTGRIDDVVFRDEKIRYDEYYGKMPMYSDIEDVLRKIEMSGNVKYKLEGKMLTITESKNGIN